MGLFGIHSVDWNALEIESPLMSTSVSLLSKAGSCIESIAAPLLCRDSIVMVFLRSILVLLSLFIELFLDKDSVCEGFSFMISFRD